VEEGDMGEEVEREDGGCTRKRERVESKGGGRVTDQHNRHCQPTQLFPVLRLYPSPGPGPDHSFIFPSALSVFVLFNCFRPYRAFCHPPLYLVSSIRLATGYCSHTTRCCAALPPRRLFIGLPAKPASEHSGAPPALTPYPNRASCLTLDAARHTASALVVHYRVLDLLFLLYGRIYKANALLSFPP
jgi:hypothetical protein